MEEREEAERPPGESDSEVQEGRGEKETAVDMNPLPNRQSRPGLRGNPRQNKKRRNRPGRRNRKERCQRERRRRKEGVSPAGADHVIVVILVVTDSSSVISVRESKSVDQASRSGPGRTTKCGRLLRPPVEHVAKWLGSERTGLTRRSGAETAQRNVKHTSATRR